MHKIYKLLLAGLLFNVTVSKANNSVDSIGVENNKGKKLIIHKVEAKETYYSLAKRYNVNFKDIMAFNDNKFLQIGIIIKVPTETSFAANTTTPQTTIASGLTAYTIKAKDNLNMLAQKFGTTVDEIKRINGLSTINLQIGQVLKIPSGVEAQEIVVNTPAVLTKPVAPIVANKPTTPVANNKPITPAENITNIEHVIKAKENLNLLAEKYGTTIDEIKRLNGLNSSNLRIGQVLKIPNANNIAVETAPVVSTPVVKTVTKPVIEQSVVKTTTSNSLEHTVIAGETIYSIAKKYGLTTYQLKAANNITGNDVTVGQKLNIKDAKPTAETFSEEETEPTTDQNTIKDPSLRAPASKYGLTQIEQKGTGIWIADQDLDPNKMLVLHKTAPVGTIIKVTNPMSNRSTFAKVVGKYTENETTKDVIIVMTKAVADAVGALDKRFYCNINYGAQENEQQ